MVLLMRVERVECRQTRRFGATPRPPSQSGQAREVLTTKLDFPHLPFFQLLQSRALLVKSQILLVNGKLHASSRPRSVYMIIYLQNLSIP